MWGKCGEHVIGGCLAVILIVGTIGFSDETHVEELSSQENTLPTTSPRKPSEPRQARIDRQPPTLGVQFHGTWNMYYPEGESAEPLPMFWQHLDSLANLGVRVLRVDIGWSTSQPTAEPPDLNYFYNRRIALVLSEALARGMNVMMTLHQTPQWARVDPEGSEKQYPADPNTITPWATWLAQNFGPQVMAFEAWNEPNLREFSGVSKAEERAAKYTPVLTAIANGLRAGDPQCVVVFGAPSYNDDVFIRQVYANGGGPYFDVMAVHPYQGDQTVPPEADDLAVKGRVTHFKEVLNVMTENGDAYKPVWWTELGYSVHDNANVPADATWLKGVPDAQTSAEYLRRTFEVARNRFPQVRLAIVYTAFKLPSDPYGHQAGYSLLDAGGSPLPQLPVLGAYLSEFGGTRPLA